MKLTKRFLSYLLLISMLTVSAPCLVFAEETAPAVENAEEMIINGGFEKMDPETTGPKSWDAFYSQNQEGYDWDVNTASMITTEKAKSGNSSLMINYAMGRSTASDVYASQIIRNIHRGATYEIGLWAYSTTGNEKFCFYYESYTAEGEYITGVRPESITPEKGKWTYHTYSFTPEGDLDRIRFYTFVGGGEVIYFDDISMKIVSPPPYAELSTNEVFYYTDLDQGWAIIDAVPYYKDVCTEWTADFKLLDGEEVLQEVSDLSFSAEKLEWIFNPKLMTDRDKTYIIRATVYDKDKTQIYTADTKLYRRYDRPKNMTRDGKLLNNDGEIFLPVSAYQVHPHIYGDRIYDECHRMGVNAVMWLYGSVVKEDVSGLCAELDKLWEQGIYAIVDLYAGATIASSPNIIEGAKRVVNAVKDHPAVFAYNIGDEPAAKLFSDDMLELAYRTVKDIDPVHPIYIVDQLVSHVKKFYKYADIVSSDNYDYIAGRYAYYRTDFWQALKGTFDRSGKASMDIYQMFKSTRGGAFDKYPTGDELRNMFYQTLFEGVSSFGYYPFDGSLEGFSVEGGGKVAFWGMELGDAAEEWMKNEREDAENYFLKGLYPTFAGKQTDDLNYRAYVKNGNIYYIVLNRRSKDNNLFEIDVKSSNGKINVASFKVRTIAGTEAAASIDKSRKGILSAELAPGEAAVFEIRPTKAIDEALLSLPTEPPFSDIADYSWANVEIEELYEKGIVNSVSDGVYAPAMNISRGDFAMFLVRTLGLNAESTESFDDVSSNAPYAKELAIGKSLGILQGVGNNKFNPEGSISRQDLMTICARGLKYAQKLNEETDNSALDEFTDSATIAEYARSAVAVMVNMGIIKGNADKTVNPLGNTTRAEAAVIMHRILNY